MDEFFGSPGAVSDPSEDKFTNDFTTVSDVSLNSFAQTDRVNPRSMMTGIHRGVQYLGGKNIYSDSENRRIVTEDNSDKRVFLGKIGDGANDWGMKVSQEGVDVAAATDDQLVFNSANNLFKIVATDTALFPAIAARVGTTFGQETLAIETEVQSDVPLICMVFAAYNSSYRQLPVVEYILDADALPISGGIFYLYNASSYLEDNIIKIRVDGQNFDTSVAPAMPLRYYVLQETAA